MGSYTLSKPRGIDIFAAAGISAMPGDVPKTTPIAMVKPFKQKVIKVKNVNHVQAKKIDAPNKLVRDKGKAPDKNGKLVAGGPGSGRHTTFNVKGPDEVDNAHEALKKEGFKYLDNGTYKHSDGRTANIFMKKRVTAGGPGSGRKPSFGQTKNKSGKEVWECKHCGVGMYTKDIKKEPSSATHCKDCGQPKGSSPDDNMKERMKKYGFDK